jgi:hypothetical protein
MKNGKIKQKMTNECEICIKTSDKMRIDFKEKKSKKRCMKVNTKKISQKDIAAKSVLDQSMIKP